MQISEINSMQPNTLQKTQKKKKRIRMPNKEIVFGERFVAKWGIEESDRKGNDEEKAKNP